MLLKFWATMYVGLNSNGLSIFLNSFFAPFVIKRSFNFVTAIYDYKDTSILSLDLHPICFQFKQTMCFTVWIFDFLIPQTL